MRPRRRRRVQFVLFCEWELIVQPTEKVDLLARNRCDRDKRLGDRGALRPRIRARRAKREQGSDGGAAPIRRETIGRARAGRSRPAAGAGRQSGHRRRRGRDRGTPASHPGAKSRRCARAPGRLDPPRRGSAETPTQDPADSRFHRASRGIQAATVPEEARARARLGRRLTKHSRRLTTDD